MRNISPEGRAALRAAGRRQAIRLNLGTVALTPEGQYSKRLEGKILGTTYGPHTVKHMRSFLTPEVLAKAGHRTASSFTSEHQSLACQKRNERHGSPLKKNPEFQRLGSAVGLHTRWHVNKNRTSPNCELCREVSNA
jgi:hypothetical protein